MTVGGTADFKANDRVVIGNCESAQIVTVTAKTATTLTMDAALIRKFGSDAAVYKIVANRYSLGKGTNGPSMLLEVDLNGDGVFSGTGEAAQELIEGIEDLQILYGVDGNGDGVPDGYVEAGTTGLDMGSVVSVRVTFTARTLENNVAATSRSYNGVSDRRVAKNFSATIAIRNRLK